MRTITHIISLREAGNGFPKVGDFIADRDGEHYQIVQFERGGAITTSDVPGIGDIMVARTAHDTDPDTGRTTDCVAVTVQPCFPRR